MHNIGTREFIIALLFGALHSLFTLFIVLSSIWVCLALWVQQPFGWLGSRIIIGIWIAFALSMAGLYFNGHIISRRTDVLIYLLAFACSLVWYFSITARQDRDWNPEVANMLSYENTAMLLLCIMSVTSTGILMEPMMSAGKPVLLT